ncbi:Sds3-like-domain-containing protein [Glomus cerebriforme]|uniref:Sds3-like-domain-containing protein n=1 Tax=Glomus cerebriforme TaxID=658196 RepID=A0A397TBB9_9GLOM|nr:Sds3-like-domain-containing protein [Glomus cerebriforme]
MLQSTSMGRSLENRLDKQTESQELFKTGTNFSIEKETSNSQISSDTELEVKKPPVSEKAEHTKSERNGIKPKTTNSWKNNVEGIQNGTTRRTNGNTTQLVSSDSPDTKTMEKSDSPLSPSTPNDSSEMSSLSESQQDDTKSKVHIVPTTSEDEAQPINENTENNRARKKRRRDTRGENGNEENGSMPVGNNKSGEPDENEKPRAEVQNDMKKVEIEFAQLRDQFYREQIGELEKEVAMINQGTHRELISRMEEIEQKRRRRLEIAASRKKYQEMHCQKQYEEAEYMAECEFMSDQYETKRKKLDDMESRKWKMIREKNRLDVFGRIECSGPDHNQLTYLKNKKLSNAAELKYVQMHYGFPAASMLDSLNKSEIEDDLILLGIARDDEVQAVATLSLSSSPKINTISGPILDSSNNRFLSEADSDIIAGGDRFLYFGQWFAKNDQVLIIDSTSGRYTAKFVAATESEVVIQRPDGSKTRLQMNLLKEGKYQIRLKES